MLVTARVLSGELSESTPYFTYRMRNHPCARWVQESPVGFMYAQRLLAALGEEYAYRYGRIHKSHAFYFGEVGALHLDGACTRPVPLAVGEHPRWEDNPVATYRHFYRADKARFARWRHCNPPHWWEEG